MQTEILPKICPICGEMVKESKEHFWVGGHLYSLLNKKVYILPICNKCNSNQGGKYFFKLKHRKNKLLKAPMK